MRLQALTLMQFSVYLFSRRGKRLEEDGMEQVERMAVSTTHIYLLK